MPLKSLASPNTIQYPGSDGEPTADDTKQGRWITRTYTGIAGLFRHDERGFVTVNVNWHPVGNEPGVVNAPDVLVAFGRPKGARHEEVIRTTNRPTRAV